MELFVLSVVVARVVGLSKAALFKVEEGIEGMTRDDSIIQEREKEGKRIGGEYCKVVQLGIGWIELGRWVMHTSAAREVSKPLLQQLVKQLWRNVLIMILASIEGTCTHRDPAMGKVRQQSKTAGSSWAGV
jgi:hypothetical protein